MKPFPRSITAHVLAVVALVSVVSCAPAISRNPVPDDMVEVAEPFGREGFRTWGDTVSEQDIEYIEATFTPMLRKEFGAELAAGQTPLLHFLALSGGGQWGAFGAGVLKGWTESGTRPEFRGVSGVSTGAIIAPFAFLGSDYDDTLREIYTTYSTDDLVEETVVSGILSGTALAATDKLGGMIARYMTPELLEKIAVEYRKGRRLLIGTTNLDAGRPVIWDIGAIADSGEEGALDLVRSLIRASASIPVAFPPIFINVKTPDGKTYDEMHVDGGASSQVTFISPEIPIAELTRRALGRNLDRKLWVIVNNDLEPPYKSIDPRITDIGSAAVSSLIRSSGAGDTYRLFAIAERDELQFHVGWIPSDVPCPKPTEDFDKIFMQCLFEVGSKALLDDALWRNEPPFFRVPEQFR